MRRMILPLTLAVAMGASLAACGGETAEGIARGFGQHVPAGGGLVETYVDVLLSDTSLVKAWIPPSSGEDALGPDSPMNRLSSGASTLISNSNLCVKVRRLDEPRGTATTIRVRKDAMQVEAWEVVRIIDFDDWPDECWAARELLGWWNDNVGRWTWMPIVPVVPATEPSNE